MMDDLELRVAELERRLVNVVRHATVTAADYENGWVQVSDDDWTSGWLPWFTSRAAGSEVTWSAPEIGERVTVFCPSGDIHQGRVMPAVYSDVSPQPSINPDITTTAHKDGGHCTYDRAAGTYTIQPRNDGLIKLVVAGTEITINEVDVNIDAAGDVNVTAGVVTLTADAVNLGGTGGEKVARVGDAVNPATMKIEEGSNVTTSL